MECSLQNVGDLRGFSYRASVPGSKSYTNRALIIAAQKVGTTRIKNALICDDTKYLAQALDKFDGISAYIEAGELVVIRSKERIGAPAEPLHMGGAGTPARFLIAFAATADGVTVVTGNPRLCERPMGDLLQALRAEGISVSEKGKAGCLPVAITGSVPTSGNWAVNGSVSSQFVSSLILLAAQQQSMRQVTIEVTGAMVSVPYIEMTLAMLRQCGVQAVRQSTHRFVIIPARPQMDEITIEPDASGMSYALTAAAITGATVRIEGIGSGSMQGDVQLVHAYARMGCQVVLGEDFISLTGAPLHGIDIDMEFMPDVVLSLAIAASQASSPTRIRNIANLRVKECDRIAAIANELGRLGIRTEEREDEITVFPGRPRTGTVHCYDDHRVAMAFSLLGLLYDGIKVDDPACVRKSFPDYWTEMHRFCELAADKAGLVEHA